MSRSPVERMLAVETTCAGSGMVVVGGSVSSVVGMVASVVASAGCTVGALSVGTLNCK